MSTVAERGAYMPSPVLYVDFGFTSAREFWGEVVLPAYEQFNAKPNRANAITASVHTWQVHDWIWHELHPGQDTYGHEPYKQFQNALFSDCRELAWIRDVAEASKHRGLSRKIDVRRMKRETRFIGPFNTAPLNTVPLNAVYSVSTPLVITMADGSVHGFSKVLSRVIDYWRAKHFW
jgi:hypothetical protein